MYWLYNRFEPDVEAHFQHLPTYQKLGFEVMGASAAKGADGPYANLPHFGRRLRNVFAWADVARRHTLSGVVSTAWSRYTYLRAACEPFETMWLTVAGSAEAYWTGSPPSALEFTRGFLRRDGGPEDEELAEMLLNPQGRRLDQLSQRLADRSALDGPSAGYWELLSVMYDLDAWLRTNTAVQNEIVHQLPLLEAGRLPRSSRLRLKERARTALARGRTLKRVLGRVLRRALPPAEVEEFLATRFDGHESVLQGLAEAIR
jgi:hypothetical protein